MDRERWRQIEELFQAASEVPPDARESFLNSRCAGDADLRRQVSVLLQQAGPQKAGDAMLATGLHQEVRSLLYQGAGDSPTESMLTSGSAVGPYQIEAPLGKGGMGQVYRARDTRLGRPVAVKFLSNTLTASPAILERFRREAQAISALNHPHVCTVHDIGEFDGRPYLVMELMEGQTLRERIAQAPFTNQELLDLMIPVLEALEAAHAAGIVHRDIKPANVFVTRRGVVKILDFGLAKSAGSESPVAAADSLTAPGTTVGTIAYMAPEQARGQEVDARSDVFACGVVLYQMATGALPFSGDNFVVTVEALLHRPPRRPRELRPDLLPAIERVIDRALEKEPRARYQTAAEMKAELQRARTNLARAALPPVRAHHWKMTAALSAGLALMAVVGWYFGLRNRPVTSPSEYVQITDFSDSATAPALSPDGRMVTFLRGGTLFLSLGQIYVKLLPSGESTQLTDEPRPKYNPVFTADGTHVAYTVLDLAESTWDTFTVPVTGGSPTHLMRNAAGMSWVGNGRILFSEVMKGTLLHMGIVTAQENRADERPIYFPEHERAMAHYSFLSPDQKSVLTVEMDGSAAWLPCRLLPMAGGQSRQIGPPGPCVAAAWSPDGKWMYFNATVNGATHIWRQRYPGGAAEQITQGPGEEQGLAIAPDGRSLVTSVGIRKSAVWIHDASGERPLSPEGSATNARYSADAKRVYYLLRKSTSGESELWVTELATGRANAALPGVAMTDFDISPSGGQVAFTALSGGERRIFLAPLDGSAPPRMVVSGADSVGFGGPDQLVFRQVEARANHLARIKTDGTGLERVSNDPILGMGFVSPDGAWAAVAGLAGKQGTVAVSLKDKTYKAICSNLCFPRWSNDGAYLYVSFGDNPEQISKSYVYAVPRGAGVPALPKGLGEIPDEQARAEMIIRAGGLGPGPDPQTYAFVKAEFVGNLFRIPLH